MPIHRWDIFFSNSTNFHCSVSNKYLTNHCYKILIKFLKDNSSTCVDINNITGEHYRQMTGPHKHNSYLFRTMPERPWGRGKYNGLYRSDIKHKWAKVLWPLLFPVAQQLEIYSRTETLATEVWLCSNTVSQFAALNLILSESWSACRGAQHWLHLEFIWCEPVAVSILFSFLTDIKCSE